MPRMRASCRTFVPGYVVDAFRLVLRCLWVAILALSLLGVVATTTGCAATAAAVTVANSEPLTFQDLLGLERKAYFRRQELDARQTAHLMGQFVGGSSSGNTIRVDDPSAPEGYTVDGQPGEFGMAFPYGVCRAADDSGALRRDAPTQ